MLISCEILLDEMRDWPSNEVMEIKKRLGIKSSTKHVQLLQVHKYFMPWHLHLLLRKCGFHDAANWLSERTNDCPEPTHESFCAHNDSLVKQYVKMNYSKVREPK